MHDRPLLLESAILAKVASPDSPASPPPMRNIIICCDGTGNEISENISNVLKLYRCLRKTEKTQPQKQQGWPMVERRDLFRICQTLPISDAEKNRRPAGGDARTAIRPVLSFIR